jgi:hypothetical protein
MEARYRQFVVGIFKERLAALNMLFPGGGLIRANYSLDPPYLLDVQMGFV